MKEADSIISNLIDEYKNKPLLPLELPLIIEQLNAENASVLDFKNHYYRDPLLCAYLIDLAWNKTKTKENHPIAADHAMSTLGIQDAKAYLDKVSLGKQPELTDEVKFIMTSSLLAAELAKNLSGNVQKSNALFWASMAHQFPDLLLWYLKPKTMWRIQYRQIKLSKKLPIFEQAKLGFELNQWRQAISQEWHMSELNQITYTKTQPEKRKQLIEYIKTGYSDKTESLKQWHHTDSWLILTSNWLARSILNPWLVNSYQHYYKITKKAFALPDKKISCAITESLRTTSDYLKGSELLVPAASFLNLKSKTHYPDWLNAAPKVPVKRDSKYIKQASELKLSAEKLAVQTFLNRLKENPTALSNPNKLFHHMLDICTKKLGFSRACLLVVDWKNKEVNTNIFVHQENRDKIKPCFSFDKPTPLTKFLVEQGFLLFESDKHAKIWDKLPQEIIQQKVKNFILFSFKPKDKVNWLVYLDRKGGKPPLPEEIQITKVLLKTINNLFANKS